MDRDWLIGRLKEYNGTFANLNVSIPTDLHKRLEAFVRNLSSKKGLDFNESEIVAEALVRFLPADDEVDLLIESLPINK